jgi:acyl carrier protein
VLSVRPPEEPVIATKRLEEIVLLAVATVSGLEPARLSRSTSLLEANVDSLTLIGLVAYLELELGLRFTEVETVELVEARDLDGLCAAVARKAAATTNGPICTDCGNIGAAARGPEGFNGVERLRGEAAESVKEDGDGRLDDVDA